MTSSSRGVRRLSALGLAGAVLFCAALAEAALMAPLLTAVAPAASGRVAAETTAPTVTAQPVMEIEAAVAERIATAWVVPPGAVTLEWGSARSFGDLLPGTPFRLAGRGVDGWFTAVFEPVSRPQVAVRVRAGVADTVFRAARPLAAGTRLSAEDMKTVLEPVWGPPLARAARPALGWELRRPVMNGEVLRAPAVAPPVLVAAGEPVSFEWMQGGVRVSVTGIALNAARLGETVRARIEARGERLAGVVTGPGTASMQGGTR